MHQRALHTLVMLLSLTAVAAAGWGVAPASAAPFEVVDVFAQFTRHIQRQTTTDKQAFSVASRCLSYFYQQERKKAPPPIVQGIAWSPDRETIYDAWLTQDEPAECRAAYPGGVEAVRTDFQRTQSLLSLSLTFYEFALVGDGDDNNRYSPRELHDVLAALKLPSDPSTGNATHLRSLTAVFDRLHESRGMEALMEGMSQLYEQGYRLTPADRASLNQVME
ncbi:MAG: hypothetical protein KF814_09035 [Nitrospiraceae bacterium]|nr:hypothetical protein [Nitrospiraceae bacterium]